MKHVGQRVPQPNLALGPSVSAYQPTAYQQALTQQAQVYPPRPAPNYRFPRQNMQGMEYYACGKSGHRVSECPDRQKLIDNQWVHLNENRRLVWGTPRNPDMEVLNRSGGPVVNTVVQGIKDRLRSQGQPVVNPLTTINPYAHEQRAHGSIGVASNTIVIKIDKSQEAGLIAEDEFLRSLRDTGLKHGSTCRLGNLRSSAIQVSDPSYTHCDEMAAVSKAALGHVPTVRNGKSKPAD
jgi:hypothetical protein